MYERESVSRNIDVLGLYSSLSMYCRVYQTIKARLTHDPSGLATVPNCFLLLRSRPFETRPLPSPADTCFPRQFTLSLWPHLLNPAGLQDLFYSFLHSYHNSIIALLILIPVLSSFPLYTPFSTTRVLVHRPPSLAFSNPLL